ncbi:putative Chaperone DnaJ-domain superfamily protein [Hibiscus syriacus]|uniref:Chaperone DnaJ-domain superfamily protein n=1 Tax=Hibiscus syriacus TaxID=106335 RepID=A0A6A2XW23_HIBSY|nr:putative Chaperone DnaJ-domain superfamily protein [Hibiscus syriacus]
MAAGTMAAGTMAAGTMATAAGAALILYCVWLRKSEAKGGPVAGEEDDDLSNSSRSVKRRIVRRPDQAPATWLEAIATISETLRFTYSETLGKWPIGDLAFGINYLMRRQGNFQVASVYGGDNCLELNGEEIKKELNNLLRLLTLCMLFSKKPFPVFLDSAGHSQEDVLLHKPKAELMKPAFTIIRDKKSKCFLLLIRGTHSIKDTLTAATARWIAKLTAPCLLKALGEYPDYKVKIVGHSLGGGTAALLTYILRERKEFASSTCFTFAPAACMTWDLAESGKHFITTIINGSDLVPTFSAASVDDHRAEIQTYDLQEFSKYMKNLKNLIIPVSDIFVYDVHTSHLTSSWLNDLRDQVERIRVLNVVYRSATALGSRLPSMATAKARVAGAGALLRPVSSSTKVVMKGAQNVAQAVVRSRSSLTSWSCIGPRRQNVSSGLNAKGDDIIDASVASESSEALVTEVVTINEMRIKVECSSGGGSGHDDTDEDEPLIAMDRVITTSTTDEIAGADASSGSRSPISSSDTSENLRFYPPGRIMHIVATPPSDAADIDDDRNGDGSGSGPVRIYETPRELYSKIRLSRAMINDHYMPMYKKMMELLIAELEKDKDCSFDAL